MKSDNDTLTAKKKAVLNVLDKFVPLIEKNQYRIKSYYGGRGGAKTHNFVRAALTRILQSKRALKVLCLRSAENTMKSSVKETFEQVIALSGLSPNFYIYDKSIQCATNGSIIEFKGMTGKGGRRAGQNLKSYEGADICWVEEAQTATKVELEILLPTIRAEGSEIWFSFNRLEEMDPVWEICNSDDEDILLIKVGWKDNPYWTDALEAERKRCWKNDRINYDHIYGGEPSNETNDYTFIDKLIVMEAQERTVKQSDYYFAPTIIGLDPARFGRDEAVFYLRQGKYSKLLAVVSKSPIPKLVDMLTQFIDKYRPEAVFVDRAEGGAIVDYSRELGYKNIFDIGFNDESTDKRYANKRAEMHGEVKDWLLAGGALENEDEIRQEVSATRQLKKDGIIQLEPKAEVKKRIGRSPGRMDALALTFARHIKTKTVREHMMHQSANRVRTTQKIVGM